VGFQLIPKSVTLNGVIALILRYLTELDRLGNRLRRSGLKQTYTVRYRISSSSYILAEPETDPHNSSTASLRQLSFLSCFLHVATL